MIQVRRRWVNSFRLRRRLLGLCSFETHELWRTKSTWGNREWSGLRQSRINWLERSEDEMMGGWRARGRRAMDEFSAPFSQIGTHVDESSVPENQKTHLDIDKDPIFLKWISYIYHPRIQRPSMKHSIHKEPSTTQPAHPLQQPPPAPAALDSDY
jgi:hypothetical protein